MIDRMAEETGPSAGGRRAAGRIRINSYYRSVGTVTVTVQLRSIYGFLFVCTKIALSLERVYHIFFLLVP